MRRSEAIFLADECVGRPIVVGLRQRFGDVISVAEATPGISDVEVLGWAMRDQRILVTEDYDFGYIALQAKLPAYAIVIVGPGVFRGDEAGSALKIVERIAMLADALAGKLTILERLRVRQRDL